MINKRGIVVTGLVCALLFGMVACTGKNGGTSIGGTTTSPSGGTSTGGATSGSTNSTVGNTTTETVTDGSTGQPITATTKLDASAAAQAAMNTYAEHTVQINKLVEAGGIKINGRTVVEGSGRTFEWSASGFVLEGELEGDVTVTIQATPSQAVRVWVDGQDVGQINMKDGKREYVLAEGLKKGKHTIRLAKVTEGTSRIIVTTLRFTGKVSMPKASDRKIEFFGDSITAGTDLFLNAVAPMKKQDGTSTYAALTAEALGADYNVIALGGWGCLGGVTGDWCNIPVLFNRASYVFSDVVWDTSLWQPDVVVINLGTNDWSYLRDYNKNEAQFEDAVKAFLQKVRAAYPNAHIVWAYGMMGNPLEDSLQRVIDEMRVRDDKMYYLLLPLSVRGKGVHPGYEDSEICSEVLAEYIKEITDWT